MKGNKPFCATLIVVLSLLAANGVSGGGVSNPSPLPTDPAFNSVSIGTGISFTSSQQTILTSITPYPKIVGANLTLTGSGGDYFYASPSNTQIYGAAVSFGTFATGTTGTAVKTRRFVTATLAAGAVTISDSAIAATTQIYPSNYTTTGGVGFPYVSSKTAGTGYTITSSNGAATNQVSVEIVDF